MTLDWHSCLSAVRADLFRWVSMWLQFAMVPTTPLLIPDMSCDWQSISKDSQAHAVVPRSPYPLGCFAYPSVPLSWPLNTSNLKSLNSLLQLQLDCTLFGGAESFFQRELLEICRSWWLCKPLGGNAIWWLTPGHSPLNVPVTPSGAGVFFILSPCSHHVSAWPMSEKNQ